MPRTQAQTQIQQEPQIPTQTCKWQSLPNQRIVEKSCPCAPTLLIPINSTIRPHPVSFSSTQEPPNITGMPNKKETRFDPVLWIVMSDAIWFGNEKHCHHCLAPSHSSPAAPPHHPSFQSSSKQTRNQLWYAGGPHTLGTLKLYHLGVNTSSPTIYVWTAQNQLASMGSITFGTSNLPQASHGLDGIC